MTMTRRRFNPLHCGAVVASWCLRHDRALLYSCFNPLHCGAVVASPRRKAGGQRRKKCFNPLHCGAVVASRTFRMSASTSSSFNPLHCGAVVASRLVEHLEDNGFRSQSPSLRGSGRFNTVDASSLNCRRVSIPFIAGQWSLLQCCETL